jgi:iron complex transport system ATP-binding protein
VSALALNGLSVDLGGSRVLEGVSGSVGPGEWVTVIGPNGAGKSTLLRAVAGLVPRRGAVAIGGDDSSSLPRRELARRVALVPQSPALPPQMTVAEYVLLGRTPHLGYLAREGSRDLEIADAALRRLDLVELAGRRLGTLSGGEQQRAVLARAFAQQAPILLLDEPTNALDVGRGQQALELVDLLRREGGLTVLAAMHDLTLAGQYADRLLLLDGGRIVAAGEVREVLTDELIGRHYGASVRILRDESGAPVVVPVRGQGGRRVPDMGPAPPP